MNGLKVKGYVQNVKTLKCGKLDGTMELQMMVGLVSEQNMNVENVVIMRVADGITANGQMFMQLR